MNNTRIYAFVLLASQKYPFYLGGSPHKMGIVPRTVYSILGSVSIESFANKGIVYSLATFDLAKRRNICGRCKWRISSLMP